MTGAPRITLSHLAFTGNEKAAVEVRFDRGLNILHGASNTGKTFTVKAIDFMLGGTTLLPDIGERIGYEKALLGLHLPKTGDATLVRSLAGGPFELVEALVDSAGSQTNYRQLSARHDANKEDNLSQFLLSELDLVQRQIASDANAKKRSLSFRDLIRYGIVDEAAIQSEASPVESGQFALTTAERSVFKLLLTGQDDSALVPVVDRRTFRTSSGAKIEVLDEMLVSVNEELASDFPDAEPLAAQSDASEKTWAAGQEEAQTAQHSIREAMAEKGRLARAIFRREQRRGEIQINFSRFEQLADVYASDIRRLEAIEEAGFVLALGGDRPCPLCGATPDDQNHSHGLGDIKRARGAAEAEIAKIHKQQKDLEITIAQLDVEGREIAKELVELGRTLERVEAELATPAPAAAEAKARLDEILSVRDHVRRGLALIQQRQSLLVRKEEIAALKPTPKADRPQLGVPSQALHDFAQKVSEVLEAWQFPGKRHVAFADGAYDLRMDGKHRKDNGKGVRAVTHAAFKVALLLYCGERGLPHPGFVVLDTPLLTYRDPIKSKDPLSSDEAALRNTSLKEFFFEHLSSIAPHGQIVVVENVDLPANIASLGHLEVFTGEPGNDRFGLFPHAVQ